VIAAQFGRRISVSDLNYVLQKVEAGRKVRVIQDRYGQERVQLQMSWLPFSTKLELTRDDINRVKEALGARSRRNRPVVPVTF
jgi:hypothetical protein